MAKKNKGQHRAQKVKKRQQKNRKLTSHQGKRSSQLAWTSDEARDSGLAILSKLEAVNSISCFNIERPEIGQCYRSAHAVEASFTVLDCSERDILSGDFWVTGVDEDNKHRVLSARDWECERIMLVSLGSL
ncbi:hypothetical protein [Vibrio sp. TBV020]|uniref:hypothetical protein n=1 Tax=Vibrio sp. TBV020 TaxID=3137398 RepID=UPI0038CDBD10